MIKITKLILSGFLVLNVLTACDDDDGNVAPVTPAAANIEQVNVFLNMLTEQNPELINLFSPNPVVSLKMNPNGTQTDQVFSGTEQVQGYFNQIFSLFSEIRFEDVRITASEDGNTVFAQFNGDFEVTSTGTPYRNVYISRVDFNGSGEIMTIEEYLNPVINGISLGLPLGPCQEVICN